MEEEENDPLPLLFIFTLPYNALSYNNNIRLFSRVDSYDFFIYAGSVHGKTSLSFTTRLTTVFNTLDLIRRLIFMCSTTFLFYLRPDRKFTLARSTIISQGVFSENL